MHRTHVQRMCQSFQNSLLVLFAVCVCLFLSPFSFSSICFVFPFLQFASFSNRWNIFNAICRCDKFKTLNQSRWTASVSLHSAFIPSIWRRMNECTHALRKINTKKKYERSYGKVQTYCNAHFDIDSFNSYGFDEMCAHTLKNNTEAKKKCHNLYSYRHHDLFVGCAFARIFSQNKTLI